MNLCVIILLLAWTVTAQDAVVFPDGSTGNSDVSSGNPEDFQNIEERLTEILGVSTRNNFNPSSESGSNACVTPDNESGICGPISDCPSYVLLLRQITDRTTATFLRNRICRIVPRSLHFCCPVTTTEAPSETGGPVEIPTETLCGLPTSEKIVGGTEIKVGSWPWLTAVGQLTENGFTAVCGGTVITRRHVLSAAHCFLPTVPRSTHVRIGDHHLTSDSDGVIPQDIRISSRRTNNYNGFTKENDIELLILAEDVTFNDFVRPACLPIDPTLRSNSFEGENATVIGWGRFAFGGQGPTSQVPMQADVPVVPLQPCSNTYMTRTLSTIVDERNICAGQGLADACSGDSGGPLNYLSPVTDRYYVIAVVSHGVECASSEFPGVYTRVGAFMDWILSNI